MDSKITEVSPLISLAFGLVFGAIIGYTGVIILSILYTGLVYRDDIVNALDTVKSKSNTTFISSFFNKNPVISKKLF